MPPKKNSNKGNRREDDGQETSKKGSKGHRGEDDSRGPTGPPVLNCADLLPCPCVSCITTNKVTHAVDDELKTMHAKIKGVGCVKCWQEAKQQPVPEPPKKGKNNPPSKKGDAVMAVSKDPLAVCFTCGQVFCMRHVDEHYFSENNARSKNSKKNVPSHSLFCCLNVSTPENPVVLCRACDKQVGTAGHTASECTEETLDRECVDNVHGIAVNAEGLAVDLDGTLSHELHMCAQYIVKRIHAPPPEKRDSSLPPLKVLKNRQEKKQEKEAQISELIAIGMKGLQNMGNTCFLNATLQALGQLRALHGLMGTHVVSGTVTIALCAFVHKISDRSQAAVLAPQVLYGAVCERARRFAGYGQHDAHDFLVTLFDLMEREERVAARMGGAGAIHRGLMSRTFRGELQSSVVCHQCHTRSQRSEELTHLSVETRMPESAFDGIGDHDVLPGGMLHEVSQRAERNCVTRAIVSFFLPEVLQGDNGYLCEVCCRAEYAEWEALARASKQADEATLVAEVAKIAEGGVTLRLEDALLVQEGAEEESSSDEEGDETPPTVVTPPPEVEAPPPPPRPPARRYVTATKQFSVTAYPPVLVIHVKRFRQEYTGAWRKDDRALTFPSLLDMSPFVGPSFRDDAPPPIPRSPLPPDAQPLVDMFPTHPVEDVWIMAKGHFETALTMLLGMVDAVPDDGRGRPRKLEYRLVGLVEHRGGMSSGHYVAYIKKIDTADWFYCSDSQVRKVTEAQAHSAEPYLLFYERC